MTLRNISPGWAKLEAVCGGSRVSRWINYGDLAVVADEESWWEAKIRSSLAAGISASSSSRARF